jgi:ribosomal-protein-serine acetyltransferase
MFSYQINENLKLILSQQHHAEEITKVVRENLDQLKLWMPWATDNYSIDSARQFIEFNLNEFATNGSFDASIIFDEKFVGGVGFHNLDQKNKSAHISYWLAKEAQGKGIITCCCRVLFDYLFDEFGLNRLQINCNIENLKSRAIPERLGFQLEGILRQVEFFDNRFGDWAVYAMLKEDWKVKS